MLIQLELDRHLLLVGLLGKNAKLYWFLNSVENFLQLKDFSKLTLTFSIENVADDTIMEEYPLQVLKLHVITHSRLLMLMDQYLKNDQKNIFKSFFYVNVRQRGSYYLLTCCSSTDADAVPFWPWINCYRRELLGRTSSGPSQLPKIVCISPTPNDLTVPCGSPPVPIVQVRTVSPEFAPSPKYSAVSPAYVPPSPYNSPASQTYTSTSLNYTPVSPSYAPPSPDYFPTSPTYTPPRTVIFSGTTTPGSKRTFIYSNSPTEYRSRSSPKNFSSDDELSDSSEHQKLTNSVYTQGPLNGFQCSQNSTIPFSSEGITIHLDRLPATKVIIRAGCLTQTFNASI